MIAKTYVACLLALLPLLPSPVHGQSVKLRDSDALKRHSYKSSERSPKVSRVVTLIVDRTNEFRKQEDLKGLKVDPKLTKAARYFADFMARTDKYGHTADGKQPWERAENHGYNYCIVLENIAYQYSSVDFATEELARKLVTGWKESPGHRKNMLDPDVTETGVAVAQSSETGRYYAVQMFGRPRSQEIAFKISNRADIEVEYTLNGRSFTLPPRYTRTHQQCRPPELTFNWPEGKQAAPSAEKVFRPKGGSQYVIRENRSGEYAVEKK